MAERFVARALAQVTRYFTDEQVREYALGQVAKLIGPETTVLLGTLGSPLGLRTIVYERLRPQPPGFSPMAARWVNLAGRDDYIATAPDLTTLFRPTQPPEAQFEGGWMVDTGTKPHDAGFYLTKREKGRPIGQTLIGEA